jgi:hypothetical protein
LFEGNPLAFLVRLSRDFPQLQLRNEASVRGREEQRFPSLAKRITFGRRFADCHARLSTS